MEVCRHIAEYGTHILETATYALYITYITRAVDSSYICTHTCMCVYSAVFLKAAYRTSPHTCNTEPQ